jgi:hypothetical protein
MVEATGGGVDRNRVYKYLDLADDAPDRRPWTLTGEVVGNGAVHEPLAPACDRSPGWVRAFWLRSELL